MLSQPALDEGTRMTHDTETLEVGWIVAGVAMAIGNVGGIISVIRTSLEYYKYRQSGARYTARPEVSKIKDIRQIARASNAVSMLCGAIYWAVDPFASRGTLPLLLSRLLFDQTVGWLIYLYAWISLSWITVFSLECELQQQRKLQLLLRFTITVFFFLPILAVMRMIQAAAAANGATVDVIHAYDTAGVIGMWFYCLIMHSQVMITAQMAITTSRRMGGEQARLRIKRLRAFQILLEVLMINFTTISCIAVFSEWAQTPPGEQVFQLMYHGCSLFASYLALWLDQRLGARMKRQHSKTTGTARVKDIISPSSKNSRHRGLQSAPPKSASRDAPEDGPGVVKDAVSPV